MSNNTLFRDTTIKILAVFFAAFLWYYVITEQNPVLPKDITIPVRIVNQDALSKNDLIMIESPDSYSVTLRLKGKKELLDSVRTNTISAYADISNYLRKGINTIPVIINGIPEGVTITARSDQTIEVTLDRRVVEQRPVTYNVTGNPILGLASMTPLLSPSEVVLTGAESLLNKVVSVRVDIDIAGSSASIEKKLPIRLLDENGKDVSGIRLDTQYINVTVPISNTKRVPILYQLLGSAAEGYMVTGSFSTPKEILVAGEQSVLDSLNNISTKNISLDNQGKAPTASFEVPVLLELPAGVQLANPNEQVKVFVEVQKVVTNTIDVTDIEFRNLNEKYIVHDSPPRSIRVTLRGPEALMANVEKNITLYIDLTNAKEGQGSYEIKLEKAPMLEILDITPSPIALDIRSRE